MNEDDEEHEEDDGEYDEDEDEGDEEECSPSLSPANLL